jgi:hypothetical protein
MRSVIYLFIPIEGSRKPDRYNTSEAGNYVLRGGHSIGARSDDSDDLG